MINSNTPKCGRRSVIGLLGGSFNPAHTGHVYISQTAIRILDIREVWWLVSPQNPLKSTKEMASLSWRLTRACQVAAVCRRIYVSDVEARLGTCYSVDTLSQILRRYPSQHFIWLMGADNLAQLPCWRQWSRLFHLVPIAILARHPYSLRALAGAAARRFARWRVPVNQARDLVGRKLPVWVFLPIRSHPASATQIRIASALALGQDEWT